jgi:hypothetical protein
MLERGFLALANKGNSVSRVSIPFPINQGALESLSPIAARKRFEKEVPEKNRNGHPVCYLS